MFFLILIIILLAEIDREEDEGTEPLTMERLNSYDRRESTGLPLRVRASRISPRRSRGGNPSRAADAFRASVSLQFARRGGTWSRGPVSPLATARGPVSPLKAGFLRSGVRDFSCRFLSNAGRDGIFRFWNSLPVSSVNVLNEGTFYVEGRRREGFLDGKQNGRLIVV